MEMYFSEDFDRIVKYSRDEAMRTGHTAVSPDHLFLGILRDGGNGAVGFLRASGVSPSELKSDLDAMIMRSRAIPWSEYDNVQLSRESQDTINLAILESRLTGAMKAAPIHLLAAICRRSESTARGLLARKGITAAEIREAAAAAEKAASSENGAAGVMPEAAEIAEELEKEIRKAVNGGGATNKIYS